MQAEVELMCKALLQRGPDEQGYYTDGNIGLGMRRLSIIDVHSGNQPVHNEDGAIQLVLNGEIYNYRELRQHLQAKGHVFHTGSDTEVIVHLYEDHGDDCVHYLRGMFAFALWDCGRQRLLVARDRLGIKPLFFGEFAGTVVFASELKALLQLPWIARELDWNAMAHLFAFMSTPRDQSIIKGIRKLEPGHLFTVGYQQPLRIRRYWDLDFTTDHEHDESWFVERLRHELNEAVQLHMICDVKFGAFLSGGLDSSAVVATMASQCRQPIKTFSIGFADKAYSELAHARVVSNVFGTEHHELVLEPDVVSLMGELAWQLDEPFGDSSALPTWMVSKLASAHVKVVLSGDGGDELFGGYDKYRVEERERRYRHVPGLLRSLLGAVGASLPEGTKGRNFLRHIALNGNERYLDAGTLFDREQQHSLFTPGAAAMMLDADPWRELAACLAKQQARSGSHWLSALQYLDITHYLPLDILTKVDRMSMANSLEARVPLLDHKLVEFAATIPPAMQLRNGTGKYIFKQAMRGILPGSIIDRTKQGFAVPLGNWFRGELNGYVRELLLSPTSRSRNIFNAGYVEQLLQWQQRGRPLDLHLWTLVSFELWCRTFLDVPVTAIGTAAGGFKRETAPQPAHAAARQLVPELLL